MRAMRMVSIRRAPRRTTRGAGTRAMRALEAMRATFGREAARGEGGPRVERSRGLRDLRGGGRISLLRGHRRGAIASRPIVKSAERNARVRPHRGAFERR